MNKEIQSTKNIITRTKHLEDMRSALLNMLEDTEGARRDAEMERNKVEAIIANFSDGLLVFDSLGRLDVINPHAEKMFGIKSEEVIGLTKEELVRFPSMINSLKILNTKGNVFRREVKIQNVFAAELTKVRIGLSKRYMGSMVILHDITREKEIEKLKTEFVSLTAHQLRTPLSAIKWVLRALSEGDLGDLKKEQKDMIDKAYKSNERMIDIINDLLNVTKIEEGRYLYQPTLSHITDIVDAAISDYSEIAKRKNIVIKVKKPQKRFSRVLVDKEKISLAIQNVIDNAIKYTPKGGVVNVSMESSEKEINIYIQDSGIGIPKTQQVRVFNKFFRATNAQTADTEGSGLGLYLVKNIVEAHDGKVSFTSTPGKGTKFTITLPIKEEVGEFLKKF